MKQEIQDNSASVKGEDLDVQVKLESQSQSQIQPEQPEVAVKAEVLDDNEHNQEPTNSVSVVTAGPEDSAGPSGEAGIQQQPQQQDRIQAYAKLQFPFFNFYIQKLSVTIGRRPPESRIPPKDEPLPPALNGNGFEHEDAKPAAAKDEEGGDVHAEDVKETSAQREDAHINGTAAVKPEQSSQQQADPQPVEHIAGDIPIEGGNLITQAKHEEDESQTRQTTPKKEEEGSQTLRPATPVPSQLSEGVLHNLEPVASTSTLPPPPLPQTTPSRFQGNKVQVDVDLGPIKAVSRDHARLFFDTNSHPVTGASNGWSIEVRGRNGLVLDGRWRAKDEVIKLTNRSKIQIAERIFYFVLPNGVPYPSAPASPSMSNTYWDEHYMNDLNGYGQSPPLVYGSDSDELRSDEDIHQQRRGSSSMSTNSRSRNASNAPVDGLANDPNEAVDPVTGKRKRGRPPKTRTAEELEERNKRSDPAAPRRPRGRPPKHVPPEQAAEERTAAATDAAAAAAPAKEPKKLSKKQLSEIKKAERERLKAEKAEAKEREKKEKEAIKEAAKAAKKAEKEKADKEKKEKDKEVKEKEAKEKAEKDRIAKEEEDKKRREAEEERRRILATQQPKQQQPPRQPTSAVAPPTQLTLPKPAPPVPAAVIPGQIDQIPSWTPTNQFIGRPDQPPYSYAALIAQAIYATPHKQAQIGHIQSWIPDKYPYFREHAPMLQAAIRKDLAVNRAFVNIPLQSGIALWAVEPEQAKYFDGNTFLPPPTADAAAAASIPSPALQSARLAPLASPSVGASPSPQPPTTHASSSKTPIIISTLPPSYIKPSPTSSADPSSMLDPNGFPPIAIHEDKMYLSPSIFATLTAQQLSNLQTLDTKQALNILQAFVVNYFKTELKKRKKAEKAAAAAAAAAQQNGTKRSAEEAMEQPSKVQKVA